MANSDYRAIILIGPPGSGKTACGRIMAKMLGWMFLDTDCLIESRTGLSVDAIFNRFGEAHFRQLEVEVLKTLARRAVSKTRPKEPTGTSDRQQPCIIATGGGTAVTPGNFELLMELGEVVCLSCQSEVLVDRLIADDSRPLFRLMPGDTRQSLGSRLDALIETRQAVYQRAGHRIETTGLSPEATALLVLQTLKLI